MRVCKDYRIPHSEFLRWSPYDRQKAVMFEIRQSEHCPDCGTHPDTWDPAKGGHPHAMEMRLEHCRGCEINEDGEKRHDEKSRARWRPGTKLRMRPVQPEEAPDGGDRVDQDPGPGQVQAPRGGPEEGIPG